MTTATPTTTPAPRKGAQDAKETPETSAKTVSKAPEEMSFQEQLAELEETSGVAGTTMTAKQASEKVEAGEADALAEHGPEPEAPAKKASGKDDSPTPRKHSTDHDPFKD